MSDSTILLLVSPVIQQNQFEVAPERLVAALERPEGAPEWAEPALEQVNGGPERRGAGLETVEDAPSLLGSLLKVAVRSNKSIR